MKCPTASYAIARRCVAALAFSLVACSEEGATPPTTAGVPLFATAIDERSRAHLIFADEMVVNGTLLGTRIQGDHRDQFGAPSAVSEYQGDFCGVRAFIYDARRESGTTEFDADTYYTESMAAACGAPRALSFDLDGDGMATLVSAPHVRLLDLWKLAVGQSVLQPQLFGMQGAISCMLAFDGRYAGASSARVTRLADVAGKRQFRVESQGLHTAACVTVLSNGKQLDTGTRYVLPFSVTVTQVPAPAPSFP